MADPRSIDERLEFLVQSTESLHASLQELHAIVAGHTTQIEGLLKTSRRDRRRIRFLMEVVEIHERRLRDLENGAQPE